MVSRLLSYVCNAPLRVAAGAVLLSLLVCGAAGSAVAQTVTATTGAVNGTVTDSTDAVLPGVTVRLGGPSLLVTRTIVSDLTGVYRFSGVPPGEYDLTFVLPGFATIIRKAVNVSLGFTATVDAQLQPGSVSDRISVSGSPVIDLASTAVTTHFTAERLASLPGARDIFAVLGQTPGVAMARPDVGGNGALSIQ